MNLLLLIILVIAEISFCVLQLGGTVRKKEWTPRRLTVNLIEVCIYLITLLLPGIDFGFRFTALFLILCARVVVSGIFFLVHRRNDKIKQKSAIVWSAVISVVLIAFSLVPAFLFSDYHGRPATGQYEVSERNVILIDRSRTEEYEKDGSSREVPVHFYYPENGKEIEAHSLPLVIFSHGAFGYYQSNTSTYMELASNGYVVASLDHPYHAFFTKDSSGKTIIVDIPFLRTAMYVGNSGEITEEEIFEITSKWMELREADMNFVIDTIKASASDASFDDSWCFPDFPEEEIAGITGLIDPDRIGLIGHSLGGATAVTVGRRDDVLAAVDLDGTMLGEETGVENGKVRINDQPYKTPLLSLDSESHHNSRIEAEETGYVYSNNVILDQDPEGYSTYFKGAAHMNFTDLPLFAPALARMLGTGSIDPEACIDQVNALVLQFFDCYLKGTGTFTVNDSY